MLALNRTDDWLTLLTDSRAKDYESSAADVTEIKRMLTSWIQKLIADSLIFNLGIF